jgi:hypothetical protein
VLQLFADLAALGRGQPPLLEDMAAEHVAAQLGIAGAVATSPWK